MGTAEDRRNPRLQLGQREGAGQVVVPTAERADLAGIIIGRREEDDRHVGQFAEALTEGDTIPLSIVQLQCDEIGSPLGSQGKRLRWRRSNSDEIACWFQGEFYQSPEPRVITKDQDGPARRAI